MNKYTFDHNGVSYNRVSKAAARKAYAAGKTVYMQSCNFRLFSFWTSPAVLNRIQVESDPIDGINENAIVKYFDKFVNSFEYYNCINLETGKYAAFYMEDEKQ